jgi:hypothetical protein
MPQDASAVVGWCDWTCGNWMRVMGDSPVVATLPPPAGWPESRLCRCVVERRGGKGGNREERNQDRPPGNIASRFVWRHPRPHRRNGGHWREGPQKCGGSKMGKIAYLNCQCAYWHIPVLQTSARRRKLLRVKPKLLSAQVFRSRRIRQPTFLWCLRSDDTGSRVATRAKAD